MFAMIITYYYLLLPTVTYYYLLPITYYYLLLPTTYYLLLPTTYYYLLPITYYLLPITYYLLPTTTYYLLLPIAYYLLLSTITYYYLLLPTITYYYLLLPTITYCLDCLSGRGTIPNIMLPCAMPRIQIYPVKIQPRSVIDGVKVPETRSSRRRVNHALYCSERVPTSHHITLASHAHPV